MWLGALGEYKLGKFFRSKLSLGLNLLEEWWSSDKHPNLGIATLIICQSNSYSLHIAFSFLGHCYQVISKYIFIYKVARRWWNNQHVILFNLGLAITLNTCSQWNWYFNGTQYFHLQKQMWPIGMVSKWKFDLHFMNSINLLSSVFKKMVISVHFLSIAVTVLYAVLTGHWQGITVDIHHRKN